MNTSTLLATLRMSLTWLSTIGMIPKEENLTHGWLFGLCRKRGPGGSSGWHRGRAMRVWSGLLIVAGLTALSGCKLFERWSKDRPSLGKPASRTRAEDDDPYRPPRNWLNNPPLPGGSASGVPPSGSLGDPRDPNFDLRSEVKGLIAGIVVDPDGRGVPYLPIRIDLTDTTKQNGAPVTVETDRNGYFLIRGLRPSQSYTLTAEATQGGRTLIGQSIVRTPSPTVRIQLREGISLPPGETTSGTDLPPPDLSSKPPPTTSIPGGVPILFDAPRTPSTVPTPVPLTRDVGELPYPVNNTPNDGAYSPVPPIPPRSPGIQAPRPPSPPRADLIAAPNPTTDKPPAANIPGPSLPLGGILPPPPLPSINP
jgi:hypothetical protein